MGKKNRLVIALVIVSALIATAIVLSLLKKAERKPITTPIANNTLASDMKMPKTIKRETPNPQKDVTSPRDIVESNIPSDDDGAKEIILNSADEPGKVEAPEIKLDENDNPVVDAEGYPLIK